MEKQDKQTHLLAEMHCKINVLIFLGAILYLADAAPAKRTATTEQLVGILSWNSGQFVAVTSDGGLYASASSQSKQNYMNVIRINISCDAILRLQILLLILLCETRTMCTPSKVTT